MKKTILLLLGGMLSISTFAQTKNLAVHSENSQLYLNPGEPDPKRPTTPIFPPMATITEQGIEAYMSGVSSNGIIGKWKLTSISADNVHTYTFTPNAGQNATTTTRSFTVFSSKTLEVKQDGKNGIYCDGLVNGNLFSLATINGQPYTVTKSNAAISTDFPENAGSPLSINSDGKIVVPYGTPEGQYKIKYKMWLTACSGNYSITTHTVNVTCHLEGARMLEVINKDIAIYPNPSNGTFNIDLRSIKEEFKKVKVFNITGALIYEGDLRAREVNPINLSGVSAGYYFAQISNNNNSQTLKLIKE